MYWFLKPDKRTSELNTFKMFSAIQNQIIFFIEDNNGYRKVPAEAPSNLPSANAGINSAPGKQASLCGHLWLSRLPAETLEGPLILKGWLLQHRPWIQSQVVPAVMGPVCTLVSPFPLADAVTGWHSAGVGGQRNIQWWKNPGNLSCGGWGGWESRPDFNLWIPRSIP